MRGLLAGAIAVLMSSVCFVDAQQYMGDPIQNSLPGVGNSEIAFWKIKDGKTNNVTLINYMSHGSNGQRLVPANIKRAVIIIHGLNEDPGTYQANMLSALSQVTDPTINFDNVAIIAPYFANGDGKNVGYPWVDGLSPGRGSISNCLVWKASQWSAGANNQYPYFSTNISSYTVLDQMVQYFDNVTMFPNMNQIVVAGHSLGAQTVQRYAALGQPLNTHSPVTYWVANPDSYVWFSTSRPLPTASCSIYDNYREGYTNFSTYPMTYGLSLVNSGRANILANYNSKAISYARGTQDLGDDASTCAAETTGANRNERFFNFIKAFPVSCSNPNGRSCDTVDFVNAGHDAGTMMASAAGLARLFQDNFNGNGSRAFDFGYPRQQQGDDPYPNPALNSSTSATNNNTYAGNMTYWGCWSDQASRSLTNMTYDSTANTIELCTATCAQGNNTIAGLEFGSQCFCGSSLGYQATQVIESSCQTPCPGNSSEICGAQNRMSLFSAGRPSINAQPGTPETVGSFYYSNCYTESTAGRALSGASTAGSFVSLEYCANFCSAFRYFGTEYADECYCGNTLGVGANVTSANDCSMICAGSTSEFCGAGNRLTVYINPNWVQGTSSSVSTTTAAAATPSGTASTSTGVSCPASNNTIVTSYGQNFTIECGIDHQAGDLTSLTVSSFQQCIDACSQNSQCVDVSLSGSACYLKSVLGAVVPSGGIWGAKLISSGSSSSTSSASVSSSSSASSASAVSSGISSSPSASASSSLSSSSSSSPSATPSAVACPGSNSTTYTTNGLIFLIECGIDHQAGDMASQAVTSFGACIDLCAATPNCVDVSLSGAMCYMKSSLGAPVNNGVFGAKLLGSASTSSLVQSSSSPSSSPSVSSIVSSTSSALPSSSSVPSSSSDSLTLGIASSSSSAASSVQSDSSSPVPSSSSTSSVLSTSSPTLPASSASSVDPSTSSIVSSTSSVFASTSSVLTSSSSSQSSLSVASSISSVSSSISSVLLSSSDPGTVSASSSSVAPSSSSIVSTSSSSSSSSLSTVSPTTLSTVTVISSASSTSSASATPTVLRCPASNNTIYTAPAGQNFLIECGIDHVAGDMSMVYVSNFTQCVNTCDSTTGCVDVSLSGTACYMKKALGAAKAASGILGAKLIVNGA